MDLNVNIGLTFTQIEWGNERKHILSVISPDKSVSITGSAVTSKPYEMSVINKIF